MGHVLKHFLETESIAIVGASNTPNRPGNIILRNLKELGFTGEVYPVNPKGDEILGLKAYKNINDLPNKTELVVSMVPAEETFDLLNNCAAKGIKNVLVVSGGFSESGDIGDKYQNEIVKLAKQKGIRLMGPNAVGPVNTSNNLVMHFYPIDYLKKGGVTFVAQSGQFCCPVMDFGMSSLHLGVSKSIDLGNCCDIDEAEVLEYLEEDPNTGVIAIYMESIRAGKRFLKVSKRVSKKKPIVVFKTGRTEYGRRTTASHTGAMAVDDTIFDVALKQAGVIRARDLDEFLDLARILDSQYRPKGNRVAVLAYNDGIGSMIADACGKFGLKFAELSKDTIEKIKPALLPSAKVSNPLDYIALKAPTDINDMYRTSLTAFMKDVNIDMVLPCFMVNKWVQNIDFKHILSDLKGLKLKPMAAWVIGEDSLVREYATILEENGIPVFPSPERAIRALGTLWRYHFHLSKIESVHG